MQEIGIDISNQRSKTLIEFFDTDMDIVFTVCEGAHAVCPVLPGAKKTIHQGFTDPSSATGTPGEIREAFRSARDEITQWVDETFKNAEF